MVVVIVLLVVVVIVIVVVVAVVGDRITFSNQKYTYLHFLLISIRYHPLGWQCWEPGATALREPYAISSLSTCGATAVPYNGLVLHAPHTRNIPLSVE